MSIKNLHIKQLYALRELIDTKSISQAANNLSITQSSMSSVLNKLRACLGDQILFRSSNEMILTARAISIQPLLSDLILNIESVFSRSQKFNPLTQEKKFTLAVTDVFECLYLDKLLAKLKDFPLITIKLISNIDKHQYSTNKFKGLDIDLFILHIKELGDCYNEVLGADDMCIVANQEFTQALDVLNSAQACDKLNHIDINKIAELPVFSGDVGALDKRNVVIKTDSIYSGLELIAQNNDLVSLVSKHVVLAFIKRYKWPLSIYPSPYVCPKSYHFLSWPNNKSSCEKNLWMRDLVRNIITGS